MKYFLDQEFIEGFHKPLFGRERHFIDLISIGLVAEDGRKYSAICSEYDYKKASRWVCSNVIQPLYEATVAANPQINVTPSNFHLTFGKPRREIAREIIAFINPHIDMGVDLLDTTPGYRIVNDAMIQMHDLRSVRTGMPDEVVVAHPKFYGYYCDYDWVLFCSLFGIMMELPDGFPKYCRDAKQELDRLASDYLLINKTKCATEKEALKYLTSHQYYPKNSNEHNAVSDAQWIYELEQFIRVFRANEGMAA